ncbi:MAG: anthranilate synthase component I, partial [Deltaproteobacteria bacterium]|nr:anthranilate synthase component I [Deltaproteobacteria bacterium]
MSRKKTVQYNVARVALDFSSDTLTPVLAFLRLSRAGKKAFLLESVEGSERWARYSFLGTRPYLVFKARGKNVEIIEDGKTRNLTADEPLRLLEEMLKEYRSVAVDG